MKIITEEFAIAIDFNNVGKADYNSLTITARNHDSHLITLRLIQGDSVTSRIDTTHMRWLANFLNETANKIDNDKDFQK